MTPQLGRGVIGSFFNPHSIGEVEAEVASLHTEMMQFGKDLADQIFLRDDAHLSSDIPRPGVPEEKIRLYQEIWRPLMNEWLRFHEIHADSILQNLPFSGAWDHTQDFRQRLLAVRDRAKAIKFDLRTPDPIPPHRDPEVDKLFGKTLEDVTKVGGYVVVGILGIMLLRTLGSPRG
jgi:hypothetical protein